MFDFYRGAYLDARIHRLYDLSALSAVISCGAATVLGTLLELGANPMLRSLNGQTALELSRVLNNDEVVTLLESALKSTIKSNCYQYWI